MCKISHKLNTDTFQIIDPILACVTSYEELINRFPSVGECEVAQGKVPSSTSNMTNTVTHMGDKWHVRRAMDFLHTFWEDLHTGSLDWNMLNSQV